MINDEDETTVCTVAEMDICGDGSAITGMVSVRRFGPVVRMGKARLNCEEYDVYEVEITGPLQPLIFDYGILPSDREHYVVIYAITESGPKRGD